MSTIRKSADLEITVLRIFEDYQRSGGEFFIISPWIQNFSFTETILNASQIKTIGSEPSLYAILKRVSEKQSESQLKIISHNFGIKTTYTLTDIDTLLAKFGTSTRDFDYGVKKIAVENLLRIYLTLKNNYSEPSKFNNPWLSIYFKYPDHYFNKISDINGYDEAVFDLVHSIEQVKTNIGNLQQLNVLQEIGNITIGLHGNFHAKIFLAGHSCVTGSSNWTYSGFVKNDEINLFVSDLDAPDELKKIKQRCMEIEKNASHVNSKDLFFIMLVHKILDALYKSLFDWLTNDKKTLLASH